ncbi:MAG: hypothetical protein AAF927_34530 [Bacteroidota bacterium]
MMYKFLFLLCLSFILTACTQNTNEQAPAASEAVAEQSLPERFPEQFVIRSKAAGSLRIGESLPMDSKIFDIEPTVETITEEGMTIEQPLYILNDASGEAIYVEAAFDDAKGTFSELIGEINVVSSDFQTTENIGVGSSIEAFIKAYPDYQIWYTYVSEMYVIESPQSIKAQFLLDPSGFKGELEIESDMTSLQISDFDPATKIIRVRLI